MWKQSRRTRRHVMVLLVMGRQYDIKGTISFQIDSFELLTVIILTCLQQKLTWSFCFICCIFQSSCLYSLSRHTQNTTHSPISFSTLQNILHQRNSVVKWYCAFNIFCKNIDIFYAVFHSCNCPNLKYTLHNSQHFSVNVFYCQVGICKLLQ